jgi:hypothetical protein
VGGIRLATSNNQANDENGIDPKRNGCRYRGDFY